MKSLFIAAAKIKNLNLIGVILKLKMIIKHFKFLNIISTIYFIEHVNGLISMHLVFSTISL
jgi:hypothetical protein